VKYKLAEKLGKREKNIIKFLKENSGSCSLTSIRKYSGIPNTTLHRIIRKLERMNMILTIKVKKIRVIILAK